MSKERLEDIKERFAKYEYDYNLNGEDIEWLIKRIDELAKSQKYSYKNNNKAGLF